MLSKRTASGNNPPFQKSVCESVRELGGNAKRHVGSEGGKKKEGSTVKLVDFSLCKSEREHVCVCSWVG